MIWFERCERFVQDGFYCLGRDLGKMTSVNWALPGPETRKLFRD